MTAIRRAKTFSAICFLSPGMDSIESTPSSTRFPLEIVASTPSVSSRRRTVSYRVFVIAGYQTPGRSRIFTSGVCRDRVFTSGSFVENVT